jgi:inosine triphosphate pyrophosphatase
MIYFITGSANKFSEVKSILSNVEQLDIDLPEIQEIDAKKIIENKLYEAKKHHDGEFIVEDTSLYLDCLKGLPGPLIKWFLKTIGNQGLFEITQKLVNSDAQAKTIIGYSNEKGEINFFEGVLTGQIVSPRGENGFGWDEIFIPSGHEKTFAQMTSDEKNQISMRRSAVNKLKEFLK